MPCTTKRRPGNVSFVRYKLGLSQQQLADTLGVSRSMIAMVETGKRKLHGPVANTYLAMCRSAEAMNPEGYTSIKRGRKPTRENFSVVTNYDSSAGKSRNEVFVAGLQQKKQTLSYLQTGLQFKKQAMEERARRFSDQLVYVSAVLNASTGLLDKLPEGKLRDKYELSAATLYVKQVKLKQQLKKCGPVALLQLEFQLNLLERRIRVTEENIARLNNGQEGSIIRVGQNDLQHDGASVLAA